LKKKKKMAGVPGFEPGMAIPKTAALPLGHTPTLMSIESGAATKIRTRDLMITNQLLYQLSYCGASRSSEQHISHFFSNVKNFLQQNVIFYKTLFLQYVRCGLDLIL
jgi:hypothetical protein